MRKSASVHVYIDAAKCAKDGVPFFQSDNGVLLTDGVEGSGILPPEYFSHVTDSSGNVLLDNRKEI
jgi:RNA:NAD 2'-phosphotransferase (TPT1/KptA family)